MSQYCATYGTWLRRPKSAFSAEAICLGAPNPSRPHPCSSSFRAPRAVHPVKITAQRRAVQVSRWNWCVISSQIVAFSAFIELWSARLQVLSGVCWRGSVWTKEPFPAGGGGESQQMAGAAWEEQDGAVLGTGLGLFPAHSDALVSPAVGQEMPGY